jgi:hypothetical protein
LENEIDEPGESTVAVPQRVCDCDEDFVPLCQRQKLEARHLSAATPRPRITWLDPTGSSSVSEALAVQQIRSRSRVNPSARTNRSG